MRSNAVRCESASGVRQGVLHAAGGENISCAHLVWSAICSVSKNMNNSVFSAVAASVVVLATVEFEGLVNRSEFSDILVVVSECFRLAGEYSAVFVDNPLFSAALWHISEICFGFFWFDLWHSCSIGVDEDGVAKHVHHGCESILDLLLPRTVSACDCRFVVLGLVVKHVQSELPHLGQSFLLKLPPCSICLSNECFWTNNRFLWHEIRPYSDRQKNFVAEHHLEKWKIFVARDFQDG